MATMNCFICMLLLVITPRLSYDGDSNDQFKNIMLKTQYDYNWMDRDPRDGPSHPPMHPVAYEPAQHLPNRSVMVLNNSLATNRQVDPTMLWDTLQREQQCCGLEDSKEWLRFSPNRRSYPKSCCSPQEVTKSSVLGMEYCPKVGKYYRNGCMPGIAGPVQMMVVTMCVTFIISMIFSMTAFLLSCCSSINYHRVTSKPVTGARSIPNCPCGRSHTSTYQSSEDRPPMYPLYPKLEHMKNGQVPYNYGTLY